MIESAEHRNSVNAATVPLAIIVEKSDDVVAGRRPRFRNVENGIQNVDAIAAGSQDNKAVLRRCHVSGRAHNRANAIDHIGVIVFRHAIV